MATSKAKRLIVLAQPKPHRHSKTPNTNGKSAASGLMPVKAHVYRSIADLNSGFEQVVRELLTLGGLNLFRANDVKAMREQISRMRAQANRDFALAIHDREKVNAHILRG
ncbi:MAG TPA: hypothetical protein VIB39_20940 [Candidatus Angelobacter sp.]|jgi:hypothetical protein